MEFLAELQSPAFWHGLFLIIWVNIILSGDNAVVIALAARSLPPEQQKKAVLWGAGAATFIAIVINSAVEAVAGSDVAATAKALRDAARTTPLLVLKGGHMAGKVMTSKDVEALAELPSREVLLSMFAGALQAPLVKTAGLLQALPRNFAYGLKALIDQQAA